MEAILRSIPSSGHQPITAFGLVRRVASALPRLPPEQLPPILALALGWAIPALHPPPTTPDAIAAKTGLSGRSLVRCGLVVLRALAKHPRLELSLPPRLVPELVGRFGRVAVSPLVALAPVLVRTPAMVLGDAAITQLTQAVAEHLAYHQADHPEASTSDHAEAGGNGAAAAPEWESRGGRRDLARAVALALWACDGNEAGGGTGPGGDADGGGAVGKLLVGVFLCLCGAVAPPRPAASAASPVAPDVLPFDPGPALGLLVGALDPAMAAASLGYLLKHWPRTVEADARLGTCVQRMAAWPLGMAGGTGGTAGSGGGGGGDGLEDSEDNEEEDDADMDPVPAGPGHGPCGGRLGLCAPFVGAWVTTFLQLVARSSRDGALLAALPAAAPFVAAQLVQPIRRTGSAAAASGAEPPDAAVSAGHGSGSNCVASSGAGTGGWRLNDDAAPAALELLGTLLCAHVHSPAAFHACVPALVAAARVAARAPRGGASGASGAGGGLAGGEGGKEGSAAAPSAVAAALATLCHTQMSLHPGHPEVCVTSRVTFVRRLRLGPL